MTEDEMLAHAQMAASSADENKRFQTIKIKTF